MIYLKKIAITITSFLMSVMVFCSPIYADEATDTINEGLSLYRKGRYSNAVIRLNQAAETILQIKSNHLKTLFPEPLTEWDASDAASDTSGIVFGGAIAVVRSYSKNKKLVSIQIMADSGMLQSAKVLLTKPVYAHNYGGKIRRIANQKAFVTYDPAEKTGEILMVIGNRFMVTISGEGVLYEDLIDYTKTIDFEKIKKLNAIGI